MSTIPVFFHVGYQKCASTFLQNALFSRHPNIHNIGKGNVHFSRSHLRNKLIITPVGDIKMERFRELWDDLKQFNNIQEKQVIMCSHENYAAFFGVDPALIASRLKNLETSASILFIIRNQFDFLASIHTHRVAVGKLYLSFKDWFNFMESNMRANSWLHHANYYKTISWFDDLFGPENVHVLFLEDLSQNKEEFTHKICQILGVDSNLGYKVIHEKDVMEERGKNRVMPRQSKWSIHTRTNSLLKSVDDVLRPITSSYIRRQIGRVTGLNANALDTLPSNYIEKVNTMYMEDNRKLAIRLDRDLSELGFPI